MRELHRVAGLAPMEGLLLFPRNAHVRNAHASGDAGGW